jgi:hypothetical protein
VASWEERRRVVGNSEFSISLYPSCSSTRNALSLGRELKLEVKTENVNSSSGQLNL